MSCHSLDSGSWGGCENTRETKNSWWTWRGASEKGNYNSLDAASSQCCIIVWGYFYEYSRW